MVNGSTIDRLIRRADKQLNHLEHDAIVRLNESLRESARNLERKVQRLYMQALEDTAGQGAALAEARARVLLQEVRALLTITDGTPADNVFNTLIRESHQVGLDNALAVLEPYQQQMVVLTGSVPVEVAAAATQTSPRLVELGNARVANAKARLIQHGTEAARAIERHVIDGIVRGQGWRKTAREVRREVGITRRAAETLVRTESVTASHNARTIRYRESGVTLATWYSTLDQRVCGYCAAKSGQTFKLEDVYIPAHPSCRCYAAPYREEWQELGLIDNEFLQKHREGAIAKAKEQGHTIHYNEPSPFERAAGLTKAPEPVWTP